MKKLATLSEPLNAKLGYLIHSWSLPSGRVWSCPGESGLCRTRCYAKHGHFHQRNVKEAHRRNFEFSSDPEFSDWMIGALRAMFARVMRVHVGGDFYGVMYARKWRIITKALPKVQFFAYTRSWRQEDILPELLQLAALPNFQLWWSIDRETGPAPLIRGVRRSYMAIDDIDAEHTPDDCDLIFRHKRKTVLQQANDVIVCPAEDGVTYDPKITCSHCRICWNQQGPIETRWQEHLQEMFEDTGVEINVP